MGEALVPFLQCKARGSLFRIPGPFVQTGGLFLGRVCSTGEGGNAESTSPRALLQIPQVLEREEVEQTHIHLVRVSHSD